MVSKVYIDTNILVDVICQRENFIAAATLLEMAKRGEIQVFVNNITIANTIYICRKSVGKEKILLMLKSLMRFVKIAPCGQTEAMMAFKTDCPDFEDALQYYSAVSIKADVIITRDAKHFTFSQVPTMTALEYLTK
jgi:predicted nucleic acid-binding protein